jgi:hypothetical protein
MGRPPPVGDEHRPLVGGPLGERRLQALAARVSGLAVVLG